MRLPFHAAGDGAGSDAAACARAHLEASASLDTLVYGWLGEAKEVELDSGMPRGTLPWLEASRRTAVLD